MVKNDMITALYNRGYFKNQARDVIDDVFQIIAEALVKEGKVIIRGFGVFEVKTRKGCLVRDIHTKELYHMDDYQVVTFSPSAALKNAIKSHNIKSLKLSDSTGEV